MLREKLIISTIVLLLNSTVTAFANNSSFCKNSTAIDIEEIQQITENLRKPIPHLLDHNIVSERLLKYFLDNIRFYRPHSKTIFRYPNKEIPPEITICDDRNLKQILYEESRINYASKLDIEMLQNAWIDFISGTSKQNQGPSLLNIKWRNHIFIYVDGESLGLQKKDSWNFLYEFKSASKNRILCLEHRPFSFHEVAFPLSSVTCFTPIRA